MALPSAELVSELEYLPDATADQVITTYAQSLGVGVIDRMFYVALGHFPLPTTLSAIASSNLGPLAVNLLIHAHGSEFDDGISLPPITEERLAAAFVSSEAFSDTNNSGRPVDPNAPENAIVVQNLFLHTLGHLPTHHTLMGFSGLTNLEAFIAFDLSAAAYDATINTTINDLRHDVQTQTGIVGQAAAAHQLII
jgi:hypothetical protein